MQPEKKRIYNNVYIPACQRQYLEKIVLEVGYMRGKRLTASAFVQFLIENYGEQAKKIFLNEGEKKVR